TLGESDHHTITSEQAITTRSLNRVSDQGVIALTSKRSPGDRKNHDQYHIESDPESPTPTARESKNGGVGDDAFFRELRRRKVSSSKARQIAAMDIDPERILRLIDTRPDRENPHSMGRLINDILDGVAGDYVAPR